MFKDKHQIMEEFHYEIEELIEEYDISYMEAIMKYIEDKNVEIEAIAPLVKCNSTLNAKLYEECESLNLVEKRQTLHLQYL